MRLASLRLGVRTGYRIFQEGSLSPYLYTMYDHKMQSSQIIRIEFICNLIYLSYLNDTHKRAVLQPD